MLEKEMEAHMRQRVLHEGGETTDEVQEMMNVWWKIPLHRLGWCKWVKQVNITDILLDLKAVSDLWIQYPHDGSKDTEEHD